MSVNSGSEGVFGRQALHARRVREGSGAPVRPEVPTPAEAAAPRTASGEPASPGSGTLRMDR